MVILIFFAFLAGIVTILSPCILPILPIILSSSFGGKYDEARPFGIVTGFIASFTFFTLFLSSIVKLLGISPDILRLISVGIVGGFGLSLLIPQFQVFVEKAFSRMSESLSISKKNGGFGSGFILGLSLGLLWTPCVGPILASVIALALTGTVHFGAVFITLAYAAGTAIPMFVIIKGGQQLLKKIPVITHHLQTIQKAFGVIMILTAIAIAVNFDRTFQTFIITTFPQYGAGLTKLEDVKPVQDQLRKINNQIPQQADTGKPTYLTLQKGPLAPEIIPGGQWFNSQPLIIKELKGKVVLIDFWTYSCINCQRTFPYLKQWWEKYKDKGLVIIGIHAPEFEFEKSKDNVAKALQDFHLTYPVVQDNNFDTWKAYNNEYWPAKYFIDKDGYIRFTHFGEGEYDKSEQVIQDLLKETGAQGIDQAIHNPEYQVYAGSPESYVGYGRLQHFSSPEDVAPDTISTYSAPEQIPLNTLAFNGKWQVTKEYANPQKGGRLFFNFSAKEVYLVMKPTGGPAKVKVFVDDKPQYFGADVIDGIVTVDGDRLYRLVDLPVPGTHILRLEFEDNNAQVFAFTFG